MLILSRKQGEKVLIEMAGETIEVIVQEKLESKPNENSQSWHQ